MTLADRIKLVNDMIRENPDSTIKEYLELVKDIEEIETMSEGTPIIYLKKVHEAIEIANTRKPIEINKNRSERYATLNEKKR